MGYNTLQHRCKCRLITFNENVIPANKLDKQALDNTAGYCHIMNTLVTEGAPRDRFAWASIGYANPPENIIIAIPSSALPPGFRMDKSNTNRMYPVLRAIIPSRLYDLAITPELVPEQERRDLAKFFIYEEQTDSYRLPSIQILSRFMAVPTFAIEAFTTAFACHNLVKYQDKHGRLVTELCAKHVWCDHCSTIAKALGAAWNALTTSRHLTQLLATFASFCDYPDDFTDTILELETFKYNQEVHICGNSCHLNRTQL